MLLKFLIATALVAFSCVQLGHSLDCYSCNSHEACLKPVLPKITCTEEIATESAKSISQFYNYVPNKKSESFYCVTMNLTQGVNLENSIYELQGCIFNITSMCALPVKNTVETPFFSYCTYCNTDLCNGNPAGTFSSSVFTMIVSAMGVLLAKKFYF